MKTYAEHCDELRDNGGIIKAILGTFYYKPSYIYHREDGPAKEWYNGDKEWYYNHKWIMDTKGNVTPEQLQEFLLRIL